ncbi:hypothetical protein GCM10028833_06770 [Glycomyces tarimensis]
MDPVDQWTRTPGETGNGRWGAGGNGVGECWRCAKGVSDEEVESFVEVWRRAGGRVCLCAGGPCGVRFVLQGKASRGFGRASMSVFPP